MSYILNQSKAQISFFFFYCPLVCDIKKVIILLQMFFCFSENPWRDGTVPLQKADYNIYDMFFAQTDLPFFFSHKRSWPHVHTFMHQPVILTQHRPVTHFPLVVRPFKIYPVACESSDCCVKPCITVIALLVGKAFHFERKDILHVEDMGVFTSTAVQTSLSCMYPLCFFVSHLQHFKSQKLTKSHHFIQWHVNVTCC